MRVNRLKIEGWRHFDHLELELDPHVTVITGVNNSGKSSILRALSVLLEPAPEQSSIARPDEAVIAGTASPQLAATEPTSLMDAASAEARVPVAERPVGQVEFEGGNIVDLVAPALSADGPPVPRPAVAMPGIFIDTNAPQSRTDLNAERISVSGSTRWVLLARVARTLHGWPAVWLPTFIRATARGGHASAPGGWSAAGHGTAGTR